MARKVLKAIVITGDIVSSAQLTAAKRHKLQTIIEQYGINFKKEYPDFQLQQYRGDSLQAILTKNRNQALKMALQLQCFLMIEQFYIRLALGIGIIDYEGKDIITSDGIAFRLSGPLVDEIKKKSELIGIAAENKNFNDEWQVHTASLNFMLQRLSPQQAEALFHYLQNEKQEDIAKALKISQPSVHQRLQAAGAQVFAGIVQRFELTVSLI